MYSIKSRPVFGKGRGILCGAALCSLALCCWQRPVQAAAMETNAAIRIVARNDFDVNPTLKPPEIAGRPFWLILPGNRLWLRSNTNPPPAPDALTQFAVATEPMVRDAANSYPSVDLYSSTNPPVVDGARLLELENINPDTPFILPVKRANSRTYLDDFKTINHKAYRRWKAEHPNFLGFTAGDELDPAYCGFLKTSPTQLVARLRQSGASETVIARTVAIATNAVKSKDQSMAGFRQLYFDGARRFFFDDPDHMVYLHSACCVDHCLLEWGAGLLTLETTSTGPYRHQQAMASARGAARQYGKPWNWYMAVCYNGYTDSNTWDNNAFPYSLTTSPTPVASDPPGHVRGPTCGMSVSLLRRDFFLGYLSGASFVQPETYPYAFWQYKDQSRKTYELSPHGQAMKEMMEFSRKHPDRGVSYAPVALLQPYNHVEASWGASSFFYFPMTRADMMIDAFRFTLLPHEQNLEKGKEGLEGCLHNSVYGDIYDILRPNPPSGPVPLAVLQNYPVAIMLGDFDLDRALAERLMQYVKGGGTLVINTRQLNKHLPADFLGAERTGAVCGTQGKVQAADGRTSATLPEPYDYDQIKLCGARPLWLDQRNGILASAHDYGRGRVILSTVDYMLPRRGLSKWAKPEDIDPYLEDMRSMDAPLIKLLMQQIVREVLPVEVQGDIEYGLNKVADGWWVYLINNRGVTKFTRTAQKLDPAATAKVTIALRDLAVKEARELLADKVLTCDRIAKSVTLDVGPGDIRIVKLITAP